MISSHGEELQAGYVSAHVCGILALMGGLVNVCSTMEMSLSLLLLLLQLF